MWRRDQTELLEEMRLANINAIINKIASLGLTSKRHLGKNVTTLTTNLGGMKDKFGLNDKDFQLIAKNFAQIRAHLKHTNDLLDKYKEYYEPTEENE